MGLPFSTWENEPCYLQNKSLSGTGIRACIYSKKLLERKETHKRRNRE